MKRTTKSELDKILGIINNIFNKDFIFDWTMGKPRLTDRNNNRNYSPRLTKKEMGIYLSGFEAALGFEKFK